MSKIIRIFIL